MSEKTPRHKSGLESVYVDGYAEMFDGDTARAALTFLAGLESIPKKQSNYAKEVAGLALRDQLMHGFDFTPVYNPKLEAIVSYREELNSDFGYALAITKPDPAPGVRIRATFYHLRFNQPEDSSLVEEPRVIDVPTMSTKVRAMSEAQNLSKKMSIEELSIAYAMLSKARSALDGVHQPLDSDVVKTLVQVDNNLDFLKQVFPSANAALQAEEDAKHEYALDSLARAAVRRHLGYAQYRKHGEAVVYLTHDHKDATYDMAIKTVHPALSQVERRVASIDILLSKDSVECIEYDPEVPIDYDDEKTSSLAKNMNGVMEALNFGTQMNDRQKRVFELQLPFERFKQANTETESPDPS